MVTLQTSGNRTRAQVAAFLRALADEIDQEPGMDTEATDVSTRVTTLGERETSSPSVTTVGHDDGRNDSPSGNAGVTNGERDGNSRTESDSEHTGSAPTRAERITFISGGDSATVSLPSTFDVDVTVKSHSPMFRSGTNQKIRIALSWNILDPDSHHDDGLRIE